MATEAESAPSAAVAAGERDTAGPARRGVVLAWVAAAAALLVPVARMVGAVVGGSRLQYGDYWMMLPRFTDATGGLVVGGLTEFQNQPVVVPQLLYWLNIRLASGSNTTLGFVVVAIAVAQVVLLAVALRRTRLAWWLPPLLTVLGGVLLLSPNGAWSFVKAMSGTAWLTANLFAVAAVVVRGRGRVLLPLALAALSAASYGTGLVAWPALAVTGLCLRPLRDWWREWPCAVGFVATFAWYRSHPDTEPASSPGLTDVLDGAARLFGLPLGVEGSAARWLGYGFLVAGTVLVAWFVATSRAGLVRGVPAAPGAAALVGITSFGLLATLEIAYARNLLIELLGLQNRYASLPALASFGVVALAVLAADQLRALRSAARPAAGDAAVAGGAHELDEAPDGRGVDGPRGRRRGALLPSAVALVATSVLVVLDGTAGGPHLEALEAEEVDQELREVALHLDLADGTTYLVGLFAEGPLTVTDRLRASGHHPFVPGWDLDCGLLGGSIPAGAGGGEVGELVGGEARFLLRGAVELVGRVDASDVRCVVVTDETGQVVGVGSLVDGPVAGVAAEPGTTAFRALARPGARAYRAYAVLEGDTTPRPLGGEVRRGDLGSG